MSNVALHARRLGAAAVATAALLPAAALAQPQVAANPVLPAYGQPVAIQVQGADWPMYLPATRFKRSGAAIEIDYEYVTDGFGPMRPDFGDAPLMVGELAPGNYAVTARFHDIAKPAAAPLVANASIAVVPPEGWGLYLIPREPQAFAATEVLVRSAAYFDPASMNASIVGNVIRVNFDYQADAPAMGPSAPAGMTTFAAVRIPTLAPGAYRVEGWGRATTGGAYERFFTKDFAVAAAVPVVEYYSPSLDHYFIAAGADEIDLVDGGGQGDWRRTGLGFKAWFRQADAPPSAAPVCRFYAKGPNSHFYTGSAQECQLLKDLQASQSAQAAARGEPFLGWGYEGIAFWTLMPVDGACAAGTAPVWRSYNNRFDQQDSNHRFTSDALQQAAMRVGWVDEGAQFCSPP